MEQEQEMKIRQFISFIPVGSRNGLRIDCIAARAGMSMRTARAMIEQVNKSGIALIINLSDAKGYFIADESEKHLERLYKAQEASRFSSLKDKLEGMNTYLGKDKQKRDEDKNQFSLSDYGIT